jgi:uncharacterized protein (DUF924 family)
MSIQPPADVLRFWFGPPVRDLDDGMSRLRRWFIDGPLLDAEVKQTFGATTEAALRGELDAWSSDARGRLALVIVLDQFTRHVFRGTTRTWEGDRKAQSLAFEAIDRGLDAELDYFERTFLAMPLAHAEDLTLQRRSMAYAARVAATAPPHLARFAEVHVEQAAKYESIIARFGRFPFRNAILGRTTTAEEAAFLVDFPARHRPQALRAHPE